MLEEAKKATGDNLDSRSQLEFYKKSLAREKDSLELYLKLRDASCEEKKVLGDLINLLAHGEEWVKNAEFGLRGEN